MNATSCYRALVSSKFLSILFADGVERPFVGAKPKEDGMSHLGLTRPLGEFYLADKFGDKPP